MNQDVLTRWVAALRSRDYVQGIGRLRRVDAMGVVRHCCLGVLCELAVQDDVVTVVDMGRAQWFTVVDEPQVVAASVLPGAVVRWAGLDACDPVVAGLPLTAWNDERRASFLRIADLLEGSA